MVDTTEEKIPRLLPSLPLPEYTYIHGTETPHPFRDQRGHSYGRKFKNMKPLVAERWAENRSFLMAIATGTFQVEGFTDRNDFIRHIAGGALMGAGGVLALGCTIGQGITGMSTLALSSVLAWLSIIAGGYLGVKYLEEGSFGGAVRAVFARG